MNAFLVALILAIIASSAGWYWDKRLGCITPIRRWCSLLLLGLGVWLVAVITIALAMKIPGAYGPVQYWYNDPIAQNFSWVRVLALFLVLGGMLLTILTLFATAIAVWKKESDRRIKALILPVVSLIAFALGYTQFISCGFYPSA